LLKAIIVLYFSLITFATSSWADEKKSPLFDLSGATPGLTPDIDRRDFKIPDIDTENFEVGLFFGVTSVENFGSNYVKGINASFFLSEDFFITLNVGFSSVNDGVYRHMNLPLFGESGQRDLIENNVLLGMNVLPGEFFFMDRQAFTSDLYVLAGMGSVRFDEDEYSSLVLGLGVRVIPRDWFAIRFESKLSEYKTNILGYEKFNHNFDVITGISVFF